MLPPNRTHGSQPYGPDGAVPPPLDTRRAYTALVYRALRSYADRERRAALPIGQAWTVAQCLRGACVRLGIPVPHYLWRWWPDAS